MKHKIDIILIYATGLVQGLVLVTVPAASSVFTDPHVFGFTSGQYGALFIPQVIMSILAALLAPKVSSALGIKTVYQAGLLFNCAAAALIAASQVLIGQALCYPCLMLGMSFVGAAFGTTLPMINVYAQRFFPQNPAGALTALHALLGTGTAMAPLLVVLFVRQIGWWILPVLAFVILIILVITSFCLSLKTQEEDAPKIQGAPDTLGFKFWIFTAIIFLYGYCETLFGNWVIIYLNGNKSILLTDASYALSVFWVMVTIGRILTSFVSNWLDPRWIYRALPVLIMISLWTVTRVHTGIEGMLFFGLAGLACSSFFPLSFSFAQGLYPALAEKVSGFLMAIYMIGYGCASYGIGRVVDYGGLTLESIYRFSIVVALIIVGLTFLVTRPSRGNHVD